MGALVRKLDWSKTSLGEIKNWSPILRGALSLSLSASAQIVMFWGPDYTALYNDAYAPSIGNKHPQALGRPGHENWAELWDDLKPLLDRARAGETVVAKDRPFQIDRNGYLEQVYFDISYSPAHGDTGDVEGVVCIVSETTDRVLNEQKLRQATERMEMALSAGAAVGTWDWDLVNDRVIADERFARLYGVDPAAAAVGAPITEFFKNIHPDDTARIGADIERTIQKHERLSTEYRLIDKDGGEHFVLARGNPIVSKDGVVRRFPGIVVDVTEQRLAERALRQVEDRARELFDALDAGVCIVEIKFDSSGNALDYKFLQINPSFEVHTGLRNAAGKWMRELEPLHEQRWFDIYGDVARTQKSVRFEDRAEALERWFDVHAVPIGHPGDHQVAIFFNDITARKRVELALRESEEQFRGVTETMPGFAWTAEPSGHINYISSQWLTYSRSTSDQNLGNAWLRFIHPDDRRNAIDGWTTSLASGQPYSSEFRLRRHDGAYRWFLVKSLPLHDEYKTIIRWIGTGNDIHDKKDAEAVLEQRLEERTRDLMLAQETLRQAQKMEAVGQLTGGIAHDFNNLLTGIIGNLDILRRRLASGRTENIERFMDAATASANRAATLTQRLLAFSRRQSLDLKAVDISQLIDSLADLLRRTLGEQITLDIQVDSTIWHALGDPNQIESALLNFAINSRDAMPSGGKLTVTARNVSLRSGHALQKDIEPGDYIALSIVDTGMGIAPDILGRVVDPFFTTKPIGQGTGLGLSMAYGYAKQARGHLTIESKPESGTTVTLYLPRSDTLAYDAFESITSSPVTGSGETVFLVEDDASVRLTVTEVLKELGYNVIEAVDGLSAIPVLQSSQRIDLLISDVGLPGMNGREVATIARKQRPELRILFISGYAKNAVVRSGFLDPGMSMITKPFTLEELSTHVQRMVKRQG